MIEELTTPFPWASYSKKLTLRIETPYSIGSFTAHDAESRNLHFATGSQGSIDEANIVTFYWLVDTTDGVIIDARFQVFGDSILIGLAEAACELVIGKNYDQAGRISAEVIEQHLCDKKESAAFSHEYYGHVNLVIDALDSCSAMCQGLPLASEYVAPPIMGKEIDVLEGGYPGWDELSLKQKLSVIDQVLEQEVRPYVEMDAGGVEVINLKENKEVIIAYSGSCTSCHSATGATLSYIQQILRAKVHPDLSVTPEI